MAELTERDRVRIAIGAAAWKWRRANNMTQDQVANILGVTKSSISSFERGTVSTGLLLAWYLDHGFTWGCVVEEFVETYHRRIDWSGVYA